MLAGILFHIQPTGQGFNLFAQAFPHCPLPELTAHVYRRGGELCLPVLLVVGLYTPLAAPGNADDGTTGHSALFIFPPMPGCTAHMFWMRTILFAVLVLGPGKAFPSAFMVGGVLRRK
jgi:hypothetical protein